MSNLVKKYRKKIHTIYKTKWYEHTDAHQRTYGYFTAEQISKTPACRFDNRKNVQLILMCTSHT